MDLVYNTAFNCIVFMIKKTYPKKVYASFEEIISHLKEQFDEIRAKKAIERLQKDGLVHLGPGGKLYLKKAGQVLTNIRAFPRYLPTESTLN